jgi:hypothetical protein
MFFFSRKSANTMPYIKQFELPVNNGFYCDARRVRDEVMALSFWALSGGQWNLLGGVPMVFGDRNYHRQITLAPLSSNSPTICGISGKWTPNDGSIQQIEAAGIILEQTQTGFAGTIWTGDPNQESPNTGYIITLTQ